MREDWLTGMDDEQLAELSAYIVLRANDCRHKAEVAPQDDKGIYRAKARAWRKFHEWLRRNSLKNEGSPKREAGR